MAISKVLIGVQKLAAGCLEYERYDGPWEVVFSFPHDHHAVEDGKDNTTAVTLFCVSGVSAAGMAAALQCPPRQGLPRPRAL